MTLLRQIQEDATSGEVAIGTVLRQCRVLASHLDNALFQEWIRHESDGYPPDAQVPPYRKLPTRLLGDFRDAFGAGVNNVEISIRFIPEARRQAFGRHLARKSIPAIEAVLARADRGICVPLPPDALRWFTNRVCVDMTCVSARQVLGLAQLVELVNCVRNKVLDFVLKIEKLDPDVGENTSGKSPLSPVKVTNVYNTTIFGGTIGAVGNIEATNVNATNVNKGDISSLQSALANSGVDAADIDDIEQALADEPKISSDGSFGPKVQAWIGKMLSKAASGIWNITSGAAGSLLTEAIRAYYGLPS